MAPEPHRPPRVLDRAAEHALKNHLTVIVGCCELLLAETPLEDPRHVDIIEMHRAATAVLAMFPQDADA